MQRVITFQFHGNFVMNKHSVVLMFWLDGMEKYVGVESKRMNLDEVKESLFDWGMFVGNRE